MDSLPNKVRFIASVSAFHSFDFDQPFRIFYTQRIRENEIMFHLQKICGSDAKSPKTENLHLPESREKKFRINPPL